MAETANSIKAKQKKVGITVFISEDIREKLLQLAELSDLKLSDVVRRALKEYTDKESY